MAWIDAYKKELEDSIAKKQHDILKMKMENEKKRADKL
jgi:hypothetical protein